MYFFSTCSNSRGGFYYSSVSDLSFVQNILEGEKMELAFELAHNMFKVASIFSHVSSNREMP